MFTIIPLHFRDIQQSVLPQLDIPTDQLVSQAILLVHKSKELIYYEAGNITPPPPPIKPTAKKQAF